MKLYLAVINWGYFDETKEAEWFHFVADSYEYEEVEKQAVQHLVDNVDVEEEHVEIDEVWINEVNNVDGYAINLTKGTK
jgi:hypothetical protein